MASPNGARVRFPAAESEIIVVVVCGGFSLSALVSIHNRTTGTSRRVPTREMFCKLSSLVFQSS